MKQHYSDILLQQYLAKDLNFIKQFLCKIHLKKCSVCQERLNTLKKEQSEIQEFSQNYVSMEHLKKELSQTSFSCTQPLQVKDDRR